MAADRVSREAVEALEAYAVYKMAQYPEAYRRFLGLAQKDNVQGMLNVANMLQAGLGTERDAAAALDWYRKAARRGSAIGMFYTGQAYLRGYGTDVDQNLARHWLKKAAVAGSSEAQLELGKLLLQQGDQAAALEWIRRAASGGDTIAASYLAGLTGGGGDDGIVSATLRASVDNAWAAIDRAISNRNAAGAVYYLAHTADIRIRLPGAKNWTVLSKRELREFWQQSFDRSPDYSMSRSELSYRREQGRIAVDSVIEERLGSTTDGERLRLQESALIGSGDDDVVIERLSVVIERF